MLERTIRLKEKIQRLESTEEKLNVLHRAFAGEKCYLVTCGPSINRIWGERVKQILADNLAVAAKQAYDLAPEVMDFHLLNPYNYKKYEYPKQKPIILMERREHDLPTPGLIYDLIFTIPAEAMDPEKILARTKNFEHYLFAKTLERPWGQGIVYELGIYLAVHLGVSELIMIGWDIGDAGSTGGRHYYDASNVDYSKSSSPKKEAKPVSKLALESYWWLKKKGIDLKSVSELMPRGLMDRILGIARTKRRYYDIRTKKTVTVYNDPGLGEGEVELIVDSTKELYYWLKQKGVALKIVSDSSLADQCIPRIEL